MIEKIKIHVRDDVPPNTVYLIGKLTTLDIETGEVVEVAPGLYVNPRKCGVIKNVT